jgi:EF hand
MGRSIWPKCKGRDCDIREVGTKDGTLDTRELRGRLSAKELAAADPDRDGSLSLDEYLAVVQQRFNAANPDNDGTLDAKELGSPAGRALLRLLK